MDDTTAKDLKEFITCAASVVCAKTGEPDDYTVSLMFHSPENARDLYILLENIRDAE